VEDPVLVQVVGMALVMDRVDMEDMALVEDPVLVQVVGMALVEDPVLVQAVEPAQVEDPVLVQVEDMVQAVGMEPVVARAKALVEGIVKALAKVSVGTMKPLVIVRTLME